MKKLMLYTLLVAPLIIFAIHTGAYISDAQTVIKNTLLEETVLYEYHLDIQPGKCPNKIKLSKGKGVNSNKKGFLPVAIMRNDGFEDGVPSSIYLMVNGNLIEPIFQKNPKIGSFAVPFDGEAIDCLDCTTLTDDGIPDLQIKFNLEDLETPLSEIQDKECIEVSLVVDGETVASDFAIVRKK